LQTSITQQPGITLLEVHIDPYIFGPRGGGFLRTKARGLALHGSLPDWLKENDPAGCDFVSDERFLAAYPDGLHHLFLSKADLLLNLHKTAS
jgi:hypothetical protein